MYKGGVIVVGEKVTTLTSAQSILVSLRVKQLKLNCILSLRQHFHHYGALQRVSMHNINKLQ